MSFKGSVIWITGASSGIGAALARALAADGPKLVLSGRQVDALRRVAQQTGLPGEDVMILPFDITDADARAATVDQVQTRFGRIDLLVNNAGISQRARVLETEMDTLRTLMEVDFFAQVALTRAVLPLMLAQGGGHVAVTASVSGKLGSQGRAGYCAAKHALMGWFDALRAEHARDRIRVTTIVPGYIDTPIAYAALTGDGSAHAKPSKGNARGMDVDACAQRIAQGLRRRRREIAVGKGLEMHALWLKRWFPGLVFRLVERMPG
ncbi:short chain dehydrogenase [Rhodothalassium salexigens]|uniref:SDR family oxidoreductase n=1 Tax=Rhodothalassium salexigens TaxID=1086 RepID=UPI001911EE3E|nr:SDR family oxidoreductase [Rhodothalassium salexigens]MBK5910719.1 short chain dehydrogenase [Rhodothalassium salexigens]